MVEKTALLVIDAQVAMFADEDPPFDGEHVLGNIRRLIDGARAAGVDVLYVRHADARYEPMMHGNAGWQVHPSIAPEPGDQIIDKRACDAFHDTSLHTVLADGGIEHLVIAGLQTEMCIDTACRSVLHRDFNVTLASDAHTTWTRNGLTPEQIIAHHNSSLADIPHPTKEILVKPAADISFV